MALVCRAIHLQQFNVVSTTSITTYYKSNRRRPVTPNDITLALCHAVRLICPKVGLVEADMSARSLRAGGAMALLCAQVDDDIIQLLGRWRSDAMLRYLHLQARPVMRNFAAHMLQHGMYDLVQNVQQQNPQAD
jgi:hypothetical protein